MDDQSDEIQRRAIGRYQCIRTMPSNPTVLLSPNPTSGSSSCGWRDPQQRVKPSRGLAKSSRHQSQAVGMDRKVVVLLLIAINGPGFRRRSIHNPEPAVWRPNPRQSGEVAFHRRSRGHGVCFCRKTGLSYLLCLLTEYALWKQDEADQWRVAQGPPLYLSFPVHRREPIVLPMENGRVWYEFQ